MVVWPFVLIISWMIELSCIMIFSTWTSSLVFALLLWCGLSPVLTLYSSNYIKKNFNNPLQAVTTVDQLHIKISREITVDQLHIKISREITVYKNLKTYKDYLTKWQSRYKWQICTDGWNHKCFLFWTCLRFLEAASVSLIT